MTVILQNKELVQRFNKEFIEDRRVQAFHELTGPGFINHAAPPGRQGADDTVQFFQAVLWPALSDLKVEILDQVGEGDRVVTRKLLHAIHNGELMGIPPTHRPVSIRVIDIWRVANGKMMEHWGMLDPNDLR